jgi:hypothetical protein
MDDGMFYYTVQLEELELNEDELVKQLFLAKSLKYLLQELG